MVESDYGDLNGPDSIGDSTSRKLDKILSSLSYRIGKTLVDSVKKPWKLVILPISLANVLFSFFFERIGRKNYILPQKNSISYKAQRDCVVLFPTNGVGLGHFSRMLSLARAIKRIKPSIEVVFVTTSPTVHPLYSNSFTCYHLPGRKKFTSMSPSVWNSICEEILANVLSLHRPSHFVFDGSYPYRGMLNAIKNRPNIHKVWVRRIGKKSELKDYSEPLSHFDRVVIPGDYIEPDTKKFSSWKVEEINLAPPLISVSRKDLLPAEELRFRLGIPEDEVVALVSLGAGVINEIGDIRRFVTDAITTRGVYAVIADSLLNPGVDYLEDSRVRVIREFPIMVYRKSFDFAVIAGGYNSIHESVLLRLPSLIIPNNSTDSDDQKNRATFASKNGGFIVIEEDDYEMLDLAIERICDESVRDQMIQSMTNGERIIDGSPFVAEALFS